MDAGGRAAPGASAEGWGESQAAKTAYPVLTNRLLPGRTQPGSLYNYINYIVTSQQDVILATVDLPRAA